MYFQSSFDSAQAARIMDGSRYRYIVPGSRCRDSQVADTMAFTCEQHCSKVHEQKYKVEIPNKSGMVHM